MKDALRRMIRANKLSLVSLIVNFLLILFSILAPWLTPYGEADMDLMHRLSPPSAEHLLGTDEAGRDIVGTIQQDAVAEANNYTNMTGRPAFNL